MADRQDCEDRLADVNLKMIGAHLPLPAEPSDAQRASWRQGPRLRLISQRGRNAPPAARGGLFMRNKRYFLPAGSAVAAALILAVLFITPTPHSAVNAAAIMTNLRETPHQGLRVAFNDIEADGVNVSGRADLVFDQPFSLAWLLDEDPPERLRLRTVLIETDIAMGPEAEHVPGLKLRATLGLSSDDLWAYFQTDDPQPLIDEAGPLAGLVAAPLKGGMLLELAALLEGEDVLDLELPKFHETGCYADHGHHKDDGAVSAEISAGFDPEKSEVSLGAGVRVSRPDQLDNEEIEALIRSFLAGTAGAEQIELAVSKIEEAASDVRVEEVEPGLHVLTARGFKAEGEERFGPSDEQWLAAMVLKVSYRDGVGVESVVIDNLGPRAGTVRVEFFDEYAESAESAKRRYVENDVTTVLDVGALLKSLDTMTSPGGPAAGTK